MNKKQKEELLAGAKKAFFEAMSGGYAGNSKDVDTRTIGDGYKTITFNGLGGYIVVDRYCVMDQSGRSAGTTTIFFGGQPIWWMAYFGYYKKRAIPCLKAALRNAYSLEFFNGGRGLHRFSNGRRPDKDGKFVYYNTCSTGYPGDSEKPRKESSFTDFGGTEWIIESKTGMRVGYHRYFGTSLI